MCPKFAYDFHEKAVHSSSYGGGGMLHEKEVTSCCIDCRVRKWWMSFWAFQFKTDFFFKKNSLLGFNYVDIC